MDYHPDYSGDAFYIYFYNTIFREGLKVVLADPSDSAVTSRKATKIRPISVS